MGLRILPSIVLAFTAFLSSGCRGAENSYQPSYGTQQRAEREYTFAVYPGQNPALLQRQFAPLIEHLNSQIEGVSFRLIASRGYDSFNQRVRAGEFDFALSNPYQAVESVKGGYRIFGKVSPDNDFRGIILVRRGSPIQSLRELRGKTISYPARTAVAAAMMPQYLLATNGVPISSTETLYVGSMESAIRNLEIGRSDAAATWTEAWRLYGHDHPAKAKRLEARWQTPPLVNNALLVHQSIPPELARRVIRLLSDLNRSGSGRKLLDHMKVAGFEQADSATYEPVRTFLREFEKRVRPIAAESVSK